MPALTVRISETTRRQLDAMAIRERRDPREQAAVLIERALLPRGARRRASTPDTSLQEDEPRR